MGILPYSADRRAPQPPRLRHFAIVAHVGKPKFPSLLRLLSARYTSRPRRRKGWRPILGSRRPPAPHISFPQTSTTTKKPHPASRGAAFTQRRSAVLAGGHPNLGRELCSIGIACRARHMVLHESLCPFRQTVHLDGHQELASDLGRHVPGRSVQSIEGHDPDRTAVATN